ncbi:MAG: DUF1858 domain-containing protein [bacterium]|nr:DUF1858 domain-containing protein [bacterium]
MAASTSSKAPRITKSINLAKLAEKYPVLAQALAEEYGLHCVGCFAAGFDTLEEGAKLHGYEDEDVKEMVDYLNELLKTTQQDKNK